MMIRVIMLTHPHDGSRFIARIGEPFSVCQVDETREATRCRIHPLLTRLPGGRLILTANIDGDIFGAERLSLLNCGCECGGPLR